MSFERICGQVFEQPILYHPRKAETLVKFLGPRLAGSAVTIVNGEGTTDHVAFRNGRPSAGIVGDRLGRAFDRADRPPFDMVDAVAIIPIEGTLVQKGKWLGTESGETSYEGLQTQIARAIQRKEVKAIAYEIDSFGGQVNGAFETAALMREASKVKPTIAILTDYAYSAGYLLASQARQIIIPEFGGAGSIGVVMMHADFSGYLEQEGIKVTLIHSGEHKVDGNPFEQLPEGLRAKWKGETDAMRERFAGVVGQGRGRRFTKAAGMKTEAASYNAQEALRLGLVDAIGDPHQAFDTFISEVNRS